MRVSKGTWRRAFMNLRCAICCLNMESPRERHGPVSTLFMAVHLRPQFIFPTRVHPAWAAFPFVAFLFSPTPGLLPRPVNLDPGNAAKEGRAQKEDRGAKESLKGIETVKISRRHHSLPPRRLSVYRLLMNV